MANDSEGTKWCVFNYISVTTTIEIHAAEDMPRNLLARKILFKRNI
jgi:hypothetical protein